MFCGTAVGNYSNETSCYYASPTNKFWKILFKTDLTSSQLEPSNYNNLIKYNIGLTDLVKGKYGLDRSIKSTDYDCESLKTNIIKYRPKVLCFNGKKAAKVFLDKSVINYGFQDETINKTKIFVAPSTSGSASNNWDESFWFKLSDYFGTKFKVVNNENYFEPDEINKLLVNIDKNFGATYKTTQKDFINTVKDIELHYSIPLGIRNMFELAKGLFCYGYLYYQFCTLGFEQSLKCFEAVITLLYFNNGGTKNSKGMEPVLKLKIDYLFDKKIINEEQMGMSSALRSLRNNSFHARSQQVVGHFSGYIEKTAQLINEIWAKD